MLCIILSQNTRKRMALQVECRGENGKDTAGRHGFTLFSFLETYQNFQAHSLKAILVRSELMYKKRKPIFCALNTLLFNSAAINTHLDGKHPEQLQNHSDYYWCFQSVLGLKRNKTDYFIYLSFGSDIFLPSI